MAAIFSSSEQNIPKNESAEFVNNYDSPSRQKVHSSFTKIHHTTTSLYREIRYIALFENDSKIAIASSYDPMIYIFDIILFKMLRRLPSNNKLCSTEITSLFMLENRKLVSGLVNGKIKIWNLYTGEFNILEGHHTCVNALCELSNNRLASGGWDSTFKIWNLQTLEKIIEYSSNEEFQLGHCLVIKKIENDNIACGNNNNIILFEVEEYSMRPIKSLIGHKDWVSDIIVINQSTIGSCSYDKTIRVWDWLKGICLLNIQAHSYYTKTLAIFNNKKLISGGLDGKLKAWNVQTGVKEDETSFATQIHKIVLNKQNLLLSAEEIRPNKQAKLRFYVIN